MLHWTQVLGLALIAAPTIYSLHSIYDTHIVWGYSDWWSYVAANALLLGVMGMIVGGTVLAMGVFA